MPAHQPILPESFECPQTAPKVSRTAGNSKNYEKRSPPCTSWSLFSSKSAVCATSTAAWVAMLVVTHQAVSACHRPVTRPNGYGIITGENFVTRPRPRDPRTCEPARVSIPMSITRYPCPCHVETKGGGEGCPSLCCVETGGRGGSCPPHS